MQKWQLWAGTALALVSGFSTSQTAQAQADDFSLEEIIVQARRRAESVQDVPLSVTAISPQQIERAFAVDIQDLEGRTPNLIIDQVNAGPRAAAISIRGISFEDIEKSFDPAVGVLIDGVYIGTNTGQLLNPFDFESIEILRGPQGTLFGKNTTAGVISVRRSRPTGELGVRAQAVVGNFGRREAQVVMNAPSIGDKLALKGTFYLQQGDGFVENVTLNETVGETDFWHASLTALFTPTDDISLLVTYDRMRDRGETVNSPLSNATDLICLAPGAPGFAPAQECGRNTGDDLYTTFSERRSPIRDDINAVTAELNIALGNFDLTAITGWRDQEEDVQQDFDSSAAAFFNTRRIQNFSQISQEVRLSGQLTDKLDGVAGLYFFKSEYDLVQLTQFGPVLGGGAPAALNPTTDHEARSFAGFADLQYQITDRWRVNGGVRWTYEEKEIVRTDGVIIDPTIDINAVPGGPLPDAARLQLSSTPGEEDWDEVTWRLTTDYKISDDFLAYASVSRGFRSGGFNGRANSEFSIGPYDPETVTAYEIGAKTDWLDGKLRVNVAAFVSKYDNKQEEIVQQTPPGSANPQETVVQNAADATIKGLEIEVTALPFDGFTINSALGLLDADYDNFARNRNALRNPATGMLLPQADLIPDDVSTLDLRRTPDVTFSIAANYEFEVGPGMLNTNVAFRYLGEYATSIVEDPSGVNPLTGEILTDATNDLRSVTDDQTLLDVAVTYDFVVNNVDIRASIFGRNLLDDRGLNSTLPVAGLFTFGTARAPRTWGGSVEIEF